jgi:predicted kinase
MITIIRGIPGSGKTTLARAMVERGDADVFVEADMWFDENGGFDPANLSTAHAWCLSEAERHHRAGRHVIVSNTFTRRWEMAPYLALDRSARIVEATGRYQNVHGVPQWKVDQMAARWERVA